MLNGLYEFAEYVDSNPYLIVVILAIGVGICFCCVKAFNYVGRTALPKRAETQVKREKCAGIITGKIGNIVRSTGARIVKNVRFDDKTMADVVVVGAFGVLALVGCNVECEVYPVDETSDEMIGYFNTKKLKFDNVMAERARVEKAVNEVLRAGDIKKCRGEAYAVFTNKHADVIAPDSMKLIEIADLAKFMRGSKYKEARGVDIDAIVKLFESVEVSE